MIISIGLVETQCASIAPDKGLNFQPKVLIFFLFLHKKHMLWYSEALLMSTHNICFHGKIRKTNYLLLSGAMNVHVLP